MSWPSPLNVADEPIERSLPRHHASHGHAASAEPVVIAADCARIDVGAAPAAPLNQNPIDRVGVPVVENSPFAYRYSSSPASIICCGRTSCGAGLTSWNVVKVLNAAPSAICSGVSGPAMGRRTGNSLGEADGDRVLRDLERVAVGHRYWLAIEVPEPRPHGGARVIGEVQRHDRPARARTVRPRQAC